MKVLFIVRATLFTVRGGDTIQVLETAAQLQQSGVDVTIAKTNERLQYNKYDLLHFFNIVRPADILVHIKRSGKPFVLSPILINYAVYDKQSRPGLAGKLFRYVSPAGIEYIKTIYRAVRGKDVLVSMAYLWKGQQRSIKEILAGAKCVLVNAAEEYTQLVKLYTITPPFAVVPNGINLHLFTPAYPVKKDETLVLCVARIEGIKNQLNLIKALNHTRFRLLIIGSAAPSHKAYLATCKKLAADNISFIEHLPQQQLLQYYAAAKVHILPSWFEVCGLSSLEAAAMGCAVVVTDNGYARSYFNDEAFYCDPGEPASILQAVQAAAGDTNTSLQQRIRSQYSWPQTATHIINAYQKYIA